jgi:hypothetical protein
MTLVNQTRTCSHKVHISGLFCLVFFIDPMTCGNHSSAVVHGPWSIIDHQLENKSEQSLSLAGRVNDTLFFQLDNNWLGKRLTSEKNST